MFAPSAAHVQRGIAASFVRLGRHQAFGRHACRAHVRWLAAVAEKRESGNLASETFSPFEIPNV